MKPIISETQKPPGKQLLTENSRSNNNLLLVGALFGFILFGIGGFFLGIINDVGFLKTSKETTTQNQQSVTLEVKTSLLKSQNLSTVTLGTAINFVPIEEIKFDFGSPRYSFQFYGIELSETDHIKFLNYAYPYSEFPTSVSLNNNLPVWLASAQNSAEMTLTKKGFICLTPFNYDPTLCADDESGSCLYPQYKGLRCTYLGKQEENTFEQVSSFILKSLTEADIGCEDQSCQVVKLSEEEITIREFSKNVIYFEEIVDSTEQEIIDLAKKEAKYSADSFIAAGWSATMTDITDKSRGWNPGVFTSIEVNATNNLFNCEHTITISNKWGAEEPGVTKKREMINCSLHPSMIEKLGV